MEGLSHEFWIISEDFDIDHSTCIKRIEDIIEKSSIFAKKRLI